jgi:hypothetical protein
MIKSGGSNEVCVGRVEASKESLRAHEEHEAKVAH